MDELDRIVQEHMRTRCQYLDALVAAVLRENGCKASELQMVERRDGTTTIWTIERKSKATGGGVKDSDERG